MSDKPEHLHGDILVTKTAFLTQGTALSIAIHLLADKLHCCEETIALFLSQRAKEDILSLSQDEIERIFEVHQRAKNEGFAVIQIEFPPDELCS
jgi:hypothetical protein